jgi:hypothetical protein
VEQLLEVRPAVLDDLITRGIPFGSNWFRYRMRRLDVS